MILLSTSRAPWKVSRRRTLLKSTSNTNTTGALTNTNLIISRSQAPPATRRGALTFAPLPWTRHTSYTACPGCDSEACGWWWAGDGWDTFAHGVLACGPVAGRDFWALGVGLTGASTAGTEGTFESSDSLPEGLVFCFDDFHLASIGGCVGVVLHGDLNASGLVWRLSRRWEGLWEWSGGSGLSVSRGYCVCRRIPGDGWTMWESVERARLARDFHRLTGWGRSS